MHLGSPSNLFGLAVVLAIAAGFVLLAAWRQRAAARFAGGRAASGNATAFWVRSLLVVLAATLAVVAMALPQWGSREYRRQEQGIDLVIALDISQSMNAKDVQPSRLGAAQTEIGRLLDSLRGNRVGLVFFAGSAILRSPLSTDMQALKDIVDRADNEPGLTRAGSDIGAAIDQAARILDASDSPGKAVLIVSDGEDFGSDATTKAAALSAKGTVVFTAGAGTAQGATILEPFGNGGQTRIKLDASGQPVITRLDESKLQAAAAAGKGRYLRLTGSGTNLVGLRDDLARLQQTPFAEQTQRIPVDRLQLFIAAAFAVLALAWLVPERLPRLALPRLRSLRPRPGVVMLLVALVIGGCGAKEDPVRTQNAAANKLYASGQYDKALEAYQKLLSGRPDLPELAYNTGNTLNRLGQYDRAVQETRRALPPTTISLGAKTYYALGNHYLAQDDLEDAYQSYRAALLLDPNDADSKYNIEVVLLRLNQQTAPGQDQPSGSGQPDAGQPSQQGPNPSGQGQPSGGNAGQGQQSNQPPSGGQQQTAGSAQLQRDLQDALAGIDQDVSVEDAVRILDLLNQLRQQRQQGPGQSGGSGPDY